MYLLFRLIPLDLTLEQSSTVRSGYFANAATSCLDRYYAICCQRQDLLHSLIAPSVFKGITLGRRTGSKILVQPHPSHKVMTWEIMASHVHERRAYIANIQKVKTSVATELMYMATLLPVEMSTKQASIVSPFFAA